MKDEIYKCTEVLKKGGIILYPTDTVWGLGCDATNEAAVQKIYDIKKRADSKSLICLVADDRMLINHVKEISDLAWDIIDIANKPTTIIYNDAKNFAANAIAQDKSIAIRMIKEGFTHRLIYNFRKPIISTSANISNKPTPLSFSEISSEIKNAVDYIVDEKFDTGNKRPSSLIKLGINGAIEILRK